MRRWILRLVFGYLAASIAAGVVLGEFALRPWPRPTPPGAVSEAERIASASGAQVSHVRLAAGEGGRLHGWHFARSLSAKLGTVIVTHGHGSSGSRILAYAAFLLDAGFDVLIPDA